MLTAEERDALQALLAHAVRPEEALNIDQLEGYLFGIAITPDVTHPSEWFTDIFGEALASFADVEESNALFGPLKETLSRLGALHRKGVLRFPFDLARFDAAMLERLRDWAAGLDRALALRSWLWLSDEVLDLPEMEEEDEEVMHALMVVLGVGHPEKIPEIFDGVDEAEEAWTGLAGDLPLAIEVLLDRAAGSGRGALN